MKVNIHTWNAADGSDGLPVRTIDVPDTTYLRSVYVGGGPGWDNGETKLGDVLCVLLGSPEPQTSAEYERLFDEYRPGPFGECLNIDGGDYASWDYEVNVARKSQVEVNELVRQIVAYHQAEMERLNA